jgi:hypothetical protein
MARVLHRSEQYPEIARGVPRGLQLGLRNYWYPVLQSEEVSQAKAKGFRCSGRHWSPGVTKRAALTFFATNVPTEERNFRPVVCWTATSSAHGMD